MNITSLSSRGQVVIPQEIRTKLGLKEGEKFIVIGEDGILILKKVEMPSFDNFDKLIKRTREFAKNKGIKKEDLDEAIKKARR